MQAPGPYYRTHTRLHPSSILIGQVVTPSKFGQFNSKICNLIDLKRQKIQWKLIQIAFLRFDTDHSQIVKKIGFIGFDSKIYKSIDLESEK